MEKVEKEMTILEKCGILFVALVAKENMPIPPMGFQSRLGDLQKATDLSPEELWEVYEYVQRQSVAMTKPKKREGLGFKRNT